MIGVDIMVTIRIENNDAQSIIFTMNAERVGREKSKVDLRLFPIQLHRFRFRTE